MNTNITSMISCIALGCLPSSALAWDTKTSTPSWNSTSFSQCKSTDPNLNQCINSSSIYIQPPFCSSGNEHAEIGDIALRYLGLDRRFGLGARSRVLIDLNETLLRKGDTKSIPGLQHRTVPAPANFAGLPDYSYTLYDWINKNRICPVLPKDASFYNLCHEFLGWMGALNANHFGTQAFQSYAHYHKVALGVARQAATMRQSLAAAGSLEARLYDGFVQEAEWEAMIFEGIGQHFLHDRWSMGHMWERWNASDPNGLAYPDFLRNMAIAGVSGLLHGSESMTNVQDPMCSPLTQSSVGSKWIKNYVQTLAPGSAVPMRWKHHSMMGRSPSLCHQKQGCDGVGDHRLMDMFDEVLGDKTVLKPLSGKASAGRNLKGLRHQRESMFRCSASGWAEVVKGFGGSESQKLVEDRTLHGLESLGALSPEVLNDELCWDMWATNWSLGVGLAGESLIGNLEGLKVPLSNRAKTRISNVTSGLSLASRVIDVFSSDSRLDPLRIAADARVQAVKSPNAITLSRRAILDFGKAKPGYQSMLATYYEPVDLNKLPMENEFGKDKWSIFGLFNHSHARFWCQDSEALEILDSLRGWEDTKSRHACQLLASRLYMGTNPDYKGSQSEKRRLSKEAAAEIGCANNQGVAIKSPCLALGASGASAYDEKIPVYLHPGYVRTVDLSSRPAYALKAMVPDSVVNWCDKLPVIDTDDKNIAATISSNGGKMILTGHNFGSSGVLSLRREGRSGNPILIDASKVDWSDKKLSITIGPDEIPAGRYAIEIVTSFNFLDRKSVGRFLLDVKAEASLCPKGQRWRGLNGGCKDIHQWTGLEGNWSIAYQTGQGERKGAVSLCPKFRVLGGTAQGVLYQKGNPARFSINKWTEKNGEYALTLFGDLGGKSAYSGWSAAWMPLKLKKSGDDQLIGTWSQVQDLREPPMQRSGQKVEPLYPENPEGPYVIASGAEIWTRTVPLISSDTVLPLKPEGFKRRDIVKAWDSATSNADLPKIRLLIKGERLPIYDPPYGPCLVVETEDKHLIFHKSSRGPSNELGLNFWLTNDTPQGRHRIWVNGVEVDFEITFQDEADIGVSEKREEPVLMSCESAYERPDQSCP